ncbi:MAG: cytochrome c class [Gemmatimonadetes bacterium]|nr:cytochrome c class [Gemmatimonadota bacterium]
MSSRFSSRIVLRRCGRRKLVGVFALVLVVAVDGCDREQRRLRESPPSATPSGVVRVSTLQPGTRVDTTHFRNPLENNAYAISEGQRLFGWYNCDGCHANGGGGMGPPLMDDKWIYGGSPENIYETIVQGRPNGMPSFAGRIPASQIWEIVAYVRSLSGQTRLDARNSRSDHMMMYPGSGITQRRENPKWSTRPPGAEMP